MTLRTRDAPSVEFPLRCAEEHMRIARAIEAGDADAAETEMREHLRAAERFVLASFVEDEAG